MSFITITRILPGENVMCSLNVDTIIWFQDVDGRCKIMTVDAHEIESEETINQVRKLVKDAG
jgi:hypothetical protein